MPKISDLKEDVKQNKLFLSFSQRSLQFRFLGSTKEVITFQNVAVFSLAGELVACSVLMTLYCLSLYSQYLIKLPLYCIVSILPSATFPLGTVLYPKTISSILPLKDEKFNSTIFCLHPWTHSIIPSLLVRALKELKSFQNLPN